MKNKRGLSAIKKTNFVPLLVIQILELQPDNLSIDVVSQVDDLLRSREQSTLGLLSLFTRRLIYTLTLLQLIYTDTGPSTSVDSFAL